MPTYTQKLEAELEQLIPEAIHWDCDQVAGWVEELGFPQYKRCFAENFISGRKLICVDASTLPKMGVTDLKHMKTIARCIRELLELEEPDCRRSIALPPRNVLGMYLQAKSVTGSNRDALTYYKYRKENAEMFNRWS